MIRKNNIGTEKRDAACICRSVLFQMCAPEGRVERSRIEMQELGFLSGWKPGQEGEKPDRNARIAISIW